MSINLNYRCPSILDGPRGNNVLSYEERSLFVGEPPRLYIAPIIHGEIRDVTIGENIVFEEFENGKLKRCVGLKHFIRLKNSSIPITIFDNHNHALYFWIEAIQEGKLKPGFELIHIDEHSDLWPNDHMLEKERALRDLKYTWEFTNFSCNVGNYIDPARKCGLIGNMIRVENEYQIDEYMEYSLQKNSVLNLDLDIFAPEMDFIDEAKKIELIQKLLREVNCVTIATSPYFIDQGIAIKKLQKIFSY